MTRVHSKNKGNNYERKIAKIFGEHWESEFSRVWNSGSYRGSARADQIVGDIVTDPSDNYPFVIEAKHREGGWTLESVMINKHDVRNWWKQVVDDAERVGKTPLLVFTRNYAEDFVMIPYDQGIYRTLITSGHPIVTTPITYEDKMTESERTFVVLITTVEGYTSIDKKEYIERYSEDTWRDTEIRIQEEEKETISEQATNVLDLMFGDN